MFGAPGSGKSHRIKQILRVSQVRDAVIFDPGHEYDLAPDAIYDCQKYPDAEALFYESINRRDAMPVRVLRPPFNQEKRQNVFDRFCDTALRIARACGRCVVVVDELHLVTEASRAPAAWGELILTGRKFGVEVICASVRPALIDKNFWTAATNIRTGRLNFAEDQRTLANALAVPIDEITALTDYAWVQRDMLTGKVTRGA